MITCTPIEIGHRGAFYDVTDDGKHLMYVATHTYAGQDGVWKPKTPDGVYACQRGSHVIPTGERFDTFEVLNVPGHKGILFVHPGNSPQKDSDGCYICGSAMGYVVNARAVIMSRNAYDKVFTPHFAGIDTFQLTIEPNVGSDQENISG